ncbi:hypothetical protein Pelo_11180 [Pelomyxa schiedti]|nr:hypothetical protein Pelo_11180 [Pelomyxa schiedti]
MSYRRLKGDEADDNHSGKGLPATKMRGRRMAGGTHDKADADGNGELLDIDEEDDRGRGTAVGKTPKRSRDDEGSRSGSPAAARAAKPKRRDGSGSAAGSGKTAGTRSGAGREGKAKAKATGSARRKGSPTGHSSDDGEQGEKGRRGTHKKDDSNEDDSENDDEDEDDDDDDDDDEDDDDDDDDEDEETKSSDESEARDRANRRGKTSEDVSPKATTTNTSDRGNNTRCRECTAKDKKIRVLEKDLEKAYDEIDLLKTDGRGSDPSNLRRDLRETLRENKTNLVEMKKLKAELASVSSEKSQLEDDYDSLKDTNEELERELEQYKQQIKEYKSALSSHKSKMASSLKADQDSQIKLQDATEESTKYKERLECLSSKNTELETKLSAVVQDCSAIIEELDNVKLELVTANENLETQKTINTELKRENEQLSLRLESAEQQLLLADRANEEYFEEVNQKLEEYKAFSETKVAQSESTTPLPSTRKVVPSEPLHTVDQLVAALERKDVEYEGKCKEYAQLKTDFECISLELMNLEKQVSSLKRAKTSTATKPHPPMPQVSESKAMHDLKERHAREIGDLEQIH